MSWKITAGFVAAVVVVAAIVIGLDHFKVGQPPPSADATQAAQITIFSFDDQKVSADRPHRQRQDGRRSSATPRRRTGCWPDSGDPANTASLTSLVFRMSSLKANSRVAGTGADLTQFGLSQPKDQLTATLDDGSKYTLLLGSNTPIGTGTYAKTDSADDVYVITTQFGSDLERLANDPRPAADARPLGRRRRCPRPPRRTPHQLPRSVPQPPRCSLVTSGPDSLWHPGTSGRVASGWSMATTLIIRALTMT